MSENYGDSRLAERFGVTRYPAIFVDDVLVATPRDFGFYGEVEGAGRYAPWAPPGEVRSDLSRIIDLILAGKKDVVSQEHAATAAVAEITTLPNFKLTDLSGHPLTHRATRWTCRAGRVLGDMVSAVPIDAAMARRPEASVRRQTRHSGDGRRISSGPDSRDCEVAQSGPEVGDRRCPDRGCLRRHYVSAHDVSV